MGLARCPDCGRVGDGVICFACGYEWPQDEGGASASGPVEIKEEVRKARSPEPRSADASSDELSAVPAEVTGIHKPSPYAQGEGLASPPRTPPPVEDAMAEAGLDFVPPEEEPGDDEEFDPFADLGVDLGVPDATEEIPKSEAADATVAIERPDLTEPIQPQDTTAPLSGDDGRIDITEPFQAPARPSSPADGFDPFGSAQSEGSFDPFADADPGAPAEAPLDAAAFAGGANTPGAKGPPSPPPDEEVNLDDLDNLEAVAVQPPLPPQGALDGLDDLPELPELPEVQARPAGELPDADLPDVDAIDMEGLDDLEAPSGGAAEEAQANGAGSAGSEEDNLSERVGALAEQLEIEGRIIEAALLYEVQAVLSSFGK